MWIQYCDGLATQFVDLQGDSWIRAPKLVLASEPGVGQDGALGKIELPEVGLAWPSPLRTLMAEIDRKARAGNATPPDLTADPAAGRRS